MKRRKNHRGGAAAVEMAILLPILALAVSAALDFGRVFHATQVRGQNARAYTQSPLPKPTGKGRVVYFANASKELSHANP